MSHWDTQEDIEREAATPDAGLTAEALQWLDGHADHALSFHRGWQADEDFPEPEPAAFTCASCEKEYVLVPAPTTAGLDVERDRHMDRVILNEARTASSPAERPQASNPWGPLPRVCCIWCQSDLSEVPHRPWCRPEQYRVTNPMPSEVRRAEGRASRPRGRSK
jgi:hypothetical protein